MILFNRFNSIALLMLILTGCATKITDPNLPLESYTAIGRAALKAPENSGQASFNWAQTSPEHLNLIIQGPLGSGRLDLTVTPTESTLTSDDRTFKDQSPDALFSEITGFDWPISGMQYWLIGKTDDRATNISRDDKGRIVSFNEDGWSIQYKKWINYKKRDIPQNIELTRGDVRLRLLVEHWKY